MMMRKGPTFNAKRLLGTAAVLAIAPAFLAAPASAQETETATSEESGEPEIVVSGQRRSLQDAVNRQRDSDFIVSALSSDDVGALPDQNVAEATRRLPGISV
jgi:outer membrane receptor for ferrienterochelin and colicin